MNSTTNRLNKINKSQNKVKSKEYIDRLLFQKKKQKEKQDKIKEELESKKIQECTFKPKINLIFPSYIKDKKSSKDKNMNNKNINRLEEMYEHGRKAVKARKNKSKIEIALFNLIYILQQNQKNKSIMCLRIFTKMNKIDLFLID